MFLITVQEAHFIFRSDCCRSRHKHIKKIRLLHSVTNIVYFCTAIDNCTLKKKM